MKKFHKVYVNEALGYRKDKSKELEEIQPIHPCFPYHLSKFWADYLNLISREISINVKPN